MPTRYAMFLAAVGLPLLGQTPPEITSTGKDRTGLGITIYHNNLAMIRETRNLELPSGPVQIAFADVAASIKPKSVWMEFGNANSAPLVFERNFEFDLLSPESAMNHSLGLPSAFRDPASGSLHWGTLASTPLRERTWALGRTHIQRVTRTGPVLREADPGALIRTREGFQGIPASEVILRALPGELRPTPTLLASVDAPQAGPCPVQFAYTAMGLSWQANYVASLAPSGKSLDLNAWVTLTNTSGTDFREATLQLVAGEPNQVWEPHSDQMDTRDQTTVEVFASSAAGPPTFGEEELSEFLLFTLDRPTTLKNLQTKQVALFRASGIPVKPIFIAQPPDATFGLGPEAYFQGSTFNPPEEPAAPTPTHLNVSWFDATANTWKNSLEALSHEEQDRIFEAWSLDEKLAEIRPAVRIHARIQNTATGGLGRPLPKGEVQVYYRPRVGREFWLSQGEMTETPAGESLDLPAGVAANISVQRKATEVNLLSRDKDTRIYEIEFEVRIRNGRREATEIQVREPVFAGWYILESTHPGTRVGTNAMDFRVKVWPARGTLLRYRVRTNPTSFVFEPSAQNPIIPGSACVNFLAVP